MLSNNTEYIQNVNNKLFHDKNYGMLALSHRLFLEKLRFLYNFIPEVCYDIGSCLLHWTKHAEYVWPQTKIYLFDAYSPVEQFYSGYDYTIGVLSNEDNKEVKFYQNDFYIGGNSYYRELFDDSKYFPENNYILKKTRTLDSIVSEKNYRLPDLIKIDVQGAELDILKGSINTLKHTKVLIVELQNVQYNKDAPLSHITMKWLENNGWKCIEEKFSDNGPDADYCFINKKFYNL
jgi:hypothetical protein